MVSVRMATSIPLDEAQQSKAVHFPKLLSSSELDLVKKCHREQLESGVRPKEHPHKRCTFLSGGGAANGGLCGTAPIVFKKLLDVAAQAKDFGKWDLVEHVDMHRLGVRVVEYWEYQPGGGLVDDYHYDGGSIATIVCLVNNENLTGGCFRTFEANGTHLEHCLECGDVLCILSHKYHNVTPVVTGQRHSLVIELHEILDDDHDEADDLDGARMAADDESGFVGCTGLAAAREALDDGKLSLEFIKVSSQSELLSCLELVEELLTASTGSSLRLHGLSFASCGLTSDNVCKLSSLLETEAGQKLTAFSVNQNPGVDHHAWHKLWAHLPEEASWLDFGDNELLDADIAPLTDALSKHESLSKLYLDGNKLEDISTLCQGLPCCKITHLDLGDNDLRDASTSALAAVIGSAALRLLVLGKNQFSCQGIRALIDALLHSSIEELYLDHTDVDDSCLAALGRALAVAKLRELHVDSTKITDEGVRELIPHVRDSELTFVDVGGNGVSKATVKLLNRTLAR